jgi:hypothetical protein
LESRKAACTARRERVESEPFTTAEMLRSEDLRLHRVGGGW